MTEFHVWAPYSKNVSLKIADQTYPMTASDGGWWNTQISEGENSTGIDYLFVLDDGGAYPDPRSPWQPEGVHGPSRTVDHNHFAWTDEGWQAPPLTSAVIYELHIGTFTPEGTFEAAVEKLDALVDLGITHIELMPVAEFPGSHGWGYDGVDLFAPHHAYGGPEGLKRLVDACHAKGLAMLLDVVYNHLGPDGNYLGKFGPYFHERHQTVWGSAINLDGPGNNEVRRFLIDNALMWLRDYHMDGLRLDAVHAIVDSSPVHFLEELAIAVEELQARLGRRLALIAESDLNDPRIVIPRDGGGYGLHAQWSDDFHHALHSVLTGEMSGYYSDYGDIADLAQSLTQVFVYNNRFSRFRGRMHGSPVVNLPYDRFLGYLQNHDQIGNRAQGERIHQIVSPQTTMIGAALVLTVPFVPMIFQGEEWGASSPFPYFTDHEDLQLAQAVRQGRWEEFAAFGWNPEQIPDPQDEQTFLSAKLNWEEREREPHRSMLDWYRSLIRLRKFHPALAVENAEPAQVTFDPRGTWLRMQRGALVVLCNFSSEPQAIPCGKGGETAQILLASAGNLPEPSQQMQLPPRSVVILQLAVREEDATGE